MIPCSGFREVQSVYISTSACWIRLILYCDDSADIWWQKVENMIFLKNKIYLLTFKCGHIELSIFQIKQ